jgi:hypothetical protein
MARYIYINLVALRMLMRLGCALCLFLIEQDLSTIFFCGRPTDKAQSLRLSSISTLLINLSLPNGQTLVILKVTFSQGNIVTQTAKENLISSPSDWATEPISEPAAILTYSG